MATSRSRRIVFQLGDKIRISPPMWDNNTVEGYPGDFSLSLPQGTGVYGYQVPEAGNLLKAAPIHEACGGAVYFDNKISKADFEALMRVMGVQPTWVTNPDKDFAVFTRESQEPGKDGYLMQMRVVSKFGLRFMFGVLDEADYKAFPEQGTTMVEALWAFIQHERECWGTSFGQDKETGLCGLFGGDGDFACEELAFGFMVENNYHHVYRIWSRAWLVTK